MDFAPPVEDIRCEHRDIIGRRCRTIAGHIGNDRAYPPRIRTHHVYTPLVEIRLPRIEWRFVLRIWRWTVYPTEGQRRRRIDALMRNTRSTKFGGKARI